MRHGVYTLAVPPNGILTFAKFTLRPNLAFSYIRSVTARHSSSGRQPNFAALSRRHHLYSAGRPSCLALAHILVPFSSSAIADWMSTILPHTMWPYANLECGSEMCCMRLAEIQNARISLKIAICAPSHNFVGLYIFATKASESEKTWRYRLHMSSQYGQRRPSNG